MNNKQGVDTINILVATDDGGCALLAALLVSIGKTTNSNVCVYIFQQSLSKTNQEKLIQTAQTVNVQIKFVEITANFDFYVPKQWPLPTLYRLTADSVLSSLDKIIYLDIDTLVYQDIRSLWEIDLGDNYLGACWGMDVNRNLGVLDPDKKVKEYFNAGVLLMNLKKMREDSIGQKCIQFMEKFNNELHAPDQDALNVICAGKIKPLPICWNWYISLERRSKRKLKMLYKDYLSKSAAIVHFYSQFKPHRSFIYLKHPIATYRIWKKSRFFWKCLAQTNYTMKHEIKIKV